MLDAIYLGRILDRGINQERQQAAHLTTVADAVGSDAARESTNGSVSTPFEAADT